MTGLPQLLLSLALAFAIPRQLRLFGDLRPGVPRALLGAGLFFFAITWSDFAAYTLLGWGIAYDLATWATRLGCALWCIKGTNLGSRPNLPTSLSGMGRMLDREYWPVGFLLLSLPVLARFMFGVVVDPEGSVWSNFNFVDTAFHLSVAQAFLASPSFPPQDLNAAGFPLKYHFIADFPLAHLARMGLPAVSSIFWLNLFSGAVAVGSVWACFEAWLRLPSRWVLLAGLLFFFANPALPNLIHYLVMSPDYFTADNFVGGVLLFPYFNFENHLNSMLEPQRGLLFSLPVALAILHVCVGPRPKRQAGNEEPSARTDSEGRRAAWAFAGVCLLPLAHVVSFAILAPCLTARLWAARPGLLRRLPWMGLFFALGLAQLWYLQCYGPPLDCGYSGWDALARMGLQNFSSLPAPLAWLAFWLAVNGDFFFWGGLFAALAFLSRHIPGELGAQLAPVRMFLRRWRVYFFICGSAFVLINFYRYAANWGDSNKFVFFLNLGLCLVIVQGAARTGPLARPLWLLFALLALLPPVWDFHSKIREGSARTHLLFHHQARFAARWMERHLPADARLITAESVDTHFVSALTTRALLAGIYSHTNPYVSNRLLNSIREAYENPGLDELRALGAGYLVISSHERTRYRLHPFWKKAMALPQTQVFAIGRPEDHNSIFIFDLKKLEPYLP